MPGASGKAFRSIGRVSSTQGRHQKGAPNRQWHHNGWGSGRGAACGSGQRHRVGCRATGTSGVSGIARQRNVTSLSIKLGGTVGSAPLLPRVPDRCGRGSVRRVEATAHPHLAVGCVRCRYCGHLTHFAQGSDYALIYSTASSRERYFHRVSPTFRHPGEPKPFREQVAVAVTLERRRGNEPLTVRSGSMVISRRRTIAASCAAPRWPSAARYGL